MLIDVEPHDIEIRAGRSTSSGPSKLVGCCVPESPPLQQPQALYVDLQQEGDEDECPFLPRGVSVFCIIRKEPRNINHYVACSKPAASFSTGRPMTDAEDHEGLVLFSGGALPPKYVGASLY